MPIDENAYANVFADGPSHHTGISRERTSYVNIKLPTFERVDRTPRSGKFKYPAYYLLSLSKRPMHASGVILFYLAIFQLTSAKFQTFASKLLNLLKIS